MSAETRPARRMLTAIGLLLVAVLLVGCGQRGPLILPGDATDAEAAIDGETNDAEDQDED